MVSEQAADLAIEISALAGLHLDPWQQHVLRVSLGQRADSKWAAFEVGLIVPRQNGKGGVIEARELAGLFVFDEHLIMHSAHEFKTASEAFIRIKTLIQNTPELDQQVAHYRTAHGDEAIELKSGARLRFVARSRGSGRGFTGDCLILDEAYNLDAQSMAALLPTLSAVPNPQVWYCSSAPMFSSSQLKGVRKRGHTQSGQRLAFCEWSIEPSMDVTDPRSWAVANPALGIRIPVEFVQSELDAMSENLPEFARERCGLAEGDDGGGGEIDMGTWVSLTRCPLECRLSHDHEYSGITGIPVIGLDINPEGTYASFAAFGPREGGGSHCETVDRRSGTEWVVSRALDLYSRHRSPIVVDGASPAGRFIEPMRKVGVPVIEVSQRQVARACGTLVDLVRQRKLYNLGEKTLLYAITNATKHRIGDIWVWSRLSTKTDISPLIAVTLAIAATETDWDDNTESVYETREMRVIG